MLSRVTAKNVGNVFLRHTIYIYIFYK